MKNIPLTLPYFGTDELKELKKCIDSNWLVEGKKTEIFQDNFAKFHNAKFAIATSSCTASLHIACKLLDLKSDHEVLVPTFSWVTSASCVEYINAKIRFVDVNVDTYNIDINLIERNITKKLEQL